MKIEDKRKVIEVLLCCSDEASTNVTDRAADAAGHDNSTTKVAADRAWRQVWHNTGLSAPHNIISTEAAYRLIESSATLRREWFGRAK